MRALIAVALLCFVIAAPAFAGDDQVVMKFSGQGSQTTRPFTVKDGWEVQWKADGNLHLATRTKDGQISAVAGGSREGAAYQPKGGTYYIEVTGHGGWTIQVVQVL